MKRFLLFFFAIYSTIALAGDAVIFDGNYVRALKDQFRLNTTARVLTGTADPTAVAVLAEKGSLYLRQTPAGAGEAYVKKDDGSSTNWDLLQTTAGPVLTANRAVVTDAAGLLSVSSTTDTQVGYLSGTNGTTGTNKLVLDTSPTLVTPVIGAATGTSLQLSGLTASRALTTDGSKNLASATTTTTQLGYLSSATGTTGTTSTNLVFSTSPIFVTPALGAATATSLQVSGLTPNRVVTSDATRILASSATTDTQVGYLSGTTGTTGTNKIVLDTSPTLVTPVIGAATGTSLSVSGQLTSTVATGTTPLVVSSTTLVPNLYVARAVLADSATTNANLTGPITSVGNATSVASQTGTGSTFVMQNTPTLTTPVIGAATGTSLQLSGLTASRAMVTDGSKNLASSATTSTQVGYLSGASGTTGTNNIVFSQDPTIAGALLSSPVVTAGGLTETQISTPSSPGSGNSIIYPKANDGYLYQLDSTGAEVAHNPNPFGEINIVLNPNGATALDINRTNDVGDWVDSGTGTTSSRSTTASEIPLSPTTTAGIKILNDGSSTGYTYMRMTLPQSLYNRKLKIAWQQYVSTSTAYASGDFKVELYWNASSNYGGAYTAFTLSTDSSGVSSIPALTGGYQTTFDASTNPYLELRITRVAGTTNSFMAMNNVVVGPGIQPQGAVIGPWLSWTPTLSTGVRGTNTEKAFWRQVGSEMEVQYTFSQTAGGTAGSGTYLFSLPNNYTIDSTQVTLGTGNTGSVVGNGYLYDGTNERSAYTMTASSTQFSVAFYTSATATSNWGSAAIPLSTTTIKALVNARIPIAEWAGSGTVNLAQNDVEHVWNSDVSSTASVTASGFAYGPGGVTISSSWSSLGTSYVRDVQFSTPIQPTDVLTVWIDKSNTGNYWVPAAVHYPFISQGTSQYGITIVGQTSTTARVTFRPQGSNPTNATYAGNGTAWSVLGERWKVTKSVSGQAVGFGLANDVSSGLVTRQQYLTNQSKTPTNALTNATNFNFSRVGNQVSITVDQIGGPTNASTSSTVDFAAGTIPSDYRPDTEIRQIISVLANATNQAGAVIVGTDGSLTYYATAAFGNFTSGASTAVRGHTFTWTKD